LPEPEYLQFMKQQYTTIMAAIKAAIHEAGAEETDFEKLHFYESTIVSDTGFGIRLVVYFINEDGTLNAGHADYFEN
jgi:hypothetical protein